jgi:hypothetical protein
MGSHQYAGSMDVDLRSATEDEQHRGLLRVLSERLVQLCAAENDSEALPPLLPEEEADEETRAILNDPTALLELIESIQDAMAGREVSLAEFRAEQRRSVAKDGTAAD